jgi:hypothetical protein
MPDRKIHIHQSDGEPCIACGDADTAETFFMTSVGDWNSEARSCSPSTRLRPDYSISGRDDPRTSALKGERMPDRRKYKDHR